MKIKKIIKEGSYLKIYVKKPFFNGFSETVHFLNNRFNDNNEAFLGCSIDESGKYIILNFRLRNKEEILKYAKNM